MTQPTNTEAQLSVAIWLVGMCAQSDGRGAAVSPACRTTASSTG